MIPSTTIVRRTIGAFRNPVTQAPGQSGILDAQRIRVSRDVYAIAIAADSHVDVCDVYPSGLGDANERIRVSVGAPFLGTIRKHDDLEILVCPVRAADQLDNAPSVDGVPFNLYPLLRLDIYTDAPPASVLMKRAPVVGHAYAAGAAATAKLALPVFGRNKIAFSWLWENAAGGATSVTPTCTLYGYTYASDGTLIPVTKVYNSITAVAVDTGGMFWITDDGAESGSTNHAGPMHWAYAIFELTPNAGTFGYRLHGEATD